jgi:hypothetical protein
MFTIFENLKNKRSPVKLIGWLVYGVKNHFQQYFSYIVGVSWLAYSITYSVSILQCDDSRLSEVPSGLPSTLHIL